MLQQMLRNVAVLTECSQYTGGARYFLSGGPARKLLKSHGLHSSHTKRECFRYEEGVRE